MTKLSSSLPKEYDEDGLGSINSELVARPTEIIEERARQDIKWGEQNHPNGTGPDGLLLDDVTDHRHGIRRFKALRNDAIVQTDLRATDGTLTFADILLEEVFEALAEKDPAKLRAELIQVAAVAAQWVEAIDRAEASN
jgi:hypothetical protein